MTKPVYLQPCYVLHVRPYRETSSLVTLFSRDFGRVNAIARGVRRMSSPLKGLLQPFQALLVTWSGQRELMMLRDAELSALRPQLTADTIWMGLYINELLNHVLVPFDAHTQIFHHYAETLLHLATQQDAEIKLRLFEKTLLAELGFGLNLQYDAYNQKIIDDAFYHYQADQGFLKANTECASRNTLYAGQSLLALAIDQIEAAHLSDIKRLMRTAINHLLQHRAIRSREMVLPKQQSQPKERLHA